MKVHRTKRGQEILEFCFEKTACRFPKRVRHVKERIIQGESIEINKWPIGSTFDDNVFSQEHLERNFANEGLSEALQCLKISGKGQENGQLSRSPGVFLTYGRSCF